MADSENKRLAEANREIMKNTGAHILTVVWARWAWGYDGYKAEELCEIYVNTNAEYDYETIYYHQREVDRQQLPNRDARKAAIISALKRSSHYRGGNARKEHEGPSADVLVQDQLQKGAMRLTQARGYVGQGVGTAKDVMQAAAAVARQKAARGAARARHKIGLNNPWRKKNDQPVPAKPVEEDAQANAARAFRATQVKGESNTVVAVQDARRILDVKENASRREIESAFRKKSLEYHPDKTGNPDTSMQNLVKQAKDLLLESLPDDKQTVADGGGTETAMVVRDLASNMYRLRF